MRLRIIIGFLASIIVCSAHAQWSSGPDPTTTDRVGIGGPIDSTVRLRLSEGQGVLTNGPFQLTFGSTASLWWGFRLDTGSHLHLDRKSDTGWAEGFVFKRDGNFGIGVDPQQLFHAARDHNAPTVLRVSNASTGNAAYAGTQYADASGVKAEIRSIGSGYTTAGGGANAFHIWNLANAPTVFATNNVERMRINADGTVAVNFPADHDARLIVQHGADNSNGIFITHQPTVEQTSITQTDKGLAIQTTENVQSGATNTGAVFGTHSWTWMTGPGVLSTMFGAFLETGPTAGGTINTSYGLYLKSLDGGTTGNGYGVYVADVKATNDYAFFQVGANDTNYFAGDVGIGVAVPDAKLHVAGNGHLTGNLVVDGNLAAKYQDVAEWVPSRSDLQPGTVVVIDAALGNGVMPSTAGYDTAVAGVVSAQPGLILGEASASKEQIATTGRVRVRVDATAGAIRVGDLLVTSNKPGYAMRSTPIDVGGAALHRPGTILGKALEPLAGGEGEILVLLSLQ